MKFLFLSSYILMRSAEAEDSGYGFTDDTQKVSPFNFGGNFGVTYLKKFEWIPNAGKDGAEQEALDIVFTINGTDKSYRMFPVTKIYDKQGVELTDTTTEDYKKAKLEALSGFSARVVHILHAFQDHDTVKAALSSGAKTFKDYCQKAANLLPADFSKVPLDIFMQFQWSPSSGQERTYLEIPKKMSYGPWLKRAIPGTWKENRLPKDQITEDTKKALWYTNENNEEHPFFKNGWFMLSNFANMQNTGSGSSSSSEAGTAMNSGAQVSNQATGNTGSDASKPSAASAW